MNHRGKEARQGPQRSVPAVLHMKMNLQKQKNELYKVYTETCYKLEMWGSKEELWSQVINYNIKSHYGKCGIQCFLECEPYESANLIPFKLDCLLPLRNIKVAGLLLERTQGHKSRTSFRQLWPQSSRLSDMEANKQKERKWYVKSVSTVGRSSYQVDCSFRSRTVWSENNIPVISGVWCTFKTTKAHWAACLSVTSRWNEERDQIDLGCCLLDLFDLAHNVLQTKRHHCTDVLTATAEGQRETMYTAFKWQRGMCTVIRTHICLQQLPQLQAHTQTHTHTQ